MRVIELEFVLLFLVKQSNRGLRRRGRWHTERSTEKWTPNVLDWAAGNKAESSKHDDSYEVTHPIAKWVLAILCYDIHPIVGKFRLLCCLGISFVKILKVLR